MSELSDLANGFQDRLTALSDRTSRAVVRLWRRTQGGELDAGWDAVAPQIDQVMRSAQQAAAASGAAYAARSMRMQDVRADVSVAIPSFAGVTAEGRDVVPELFSAVTATKTLIGRGSGVPAAFQAGSGLMSVLAGNIVHDTGRNAASVGAVAAGSRHSVRVVQPGACSRCAILAGVIGYRTNFERHPKCRCTSMWLTDGKAPEGFFSSPADYFDSLPGAEQDRVFTKAGAEAIRLGADPAKVVNARRGALTSVKRADGTFSRARLLPKPIGIRPDGSPLMVYATPEGTTYRSRWARAQGNSIRAAGDRYRRTASIRLMPEQIMQMSTDPERMRELLQRYGYLY